MCAFFFSSAATDHRSSPTPEGHLWCNMIIFVKKQKIVVIKIYRSSFFRKLNTANWYILSSWRFLPTIPCTSSIFYGFSTPSSKWRRSCYGGSFNIFVHFCQAPTVKKLGGHSDFGFASCADEWLYMSERKTSPLSICTASTSSSPERHFKIMAGVVFAAFPLLASLQTLWHWQWTNPVRASTNRCSI